MVPPSLAPLLSRSGFCALYVPVLVGAGILRASAGGFTRSLWNSNKAHLCLFFCWLVRSAAEQLRKKAIVVEVDGPQHFYRDSLHW